MKKLTFLLFTTLISFGIKAQPTVTIGANPNSAEIGISTTFTATFNANGATGITIERYKWSIPSIGAGISGPSGIEGSIDGYTTNVEPYTVTTSNTSNSVNVIWGDFFDPCSDKIDVTVYYLQNDVEQYIFLDPSKDVKLFCVSTPEISGPSSIQDCCNDNKVFCDYSSGTQDVWDWTVTSGTIISGDGTHCITVEPSTNNNLSVECVAFRQNGSQDYSRTNTVNVSRTQPHTPAITGPNFVCKGNTVTLCVNALCDEVGVQWSDVSSALTLTSGQGTTCAVYTPNSSAANGTLVNVTA